jgi:hypothetical protein
VVASSSPWASQGQEWSRVGWCGGQPVALGSLNTVYSYINSDKIKDSIKKWSRVGWAASPSPWAKPGGGMVTGGRQPGSLGRNGHGWAPARQPGQEWSRVGASPAGRGRNGHGWAQPGSLGRNGHGWAQPGSLGRNGHGWAGWRAPAVLIEYLVIYNRVNRYIK